MPQIRRVTFKGDKGIEIRTRALRLVATTSRGPRIAFFGTPDGDNLLYWNPGKHRRGQWDLMGGHRLWTTRPGADEAEETYNADNGACSVEVARGAVTLTAPVDAATQLQRGIRIRAAGADRVVLEHFVRNIGDMLWHGGLWGLTCTRPTKDAFYCAPLGDGSKWDYATVIAFRSWGGGHGQGHFDDGQFNLARDRFELRPAGLETKRMVKADPGVLAMHDRGHGVLFAIQAKYEAAADYPLGTNVAFYVGPENFMVEMETMSPFVTLKPGDSMSHVETWVLRPAGSRAPSASALKKLFK